MARTPVRRYRRLINVRLAKSPEYRGDGGAALAARTRGGRLTGVEGLRAVAASSIVIYHVWLYGSPAGPVDVGYLSRFALPHLPVGVTLFFALSGYLLYRPIAASLVATRQIPSVKNYLRNRILRILPAYWVILIAVAVVLPAALLRLSPAELVLDRLLDHPGILLNNALLIHNYVPASLDTGIGPAWSLAIEVMFYLSLPGLAVLARYYYRRAGKPLGRLCALLAPPVTLLLVGAAGKAATVWLVPPGDTPVHAILARSFISHADLFAPGMTLAVLHVLAVSNKVRLPRQWPVIAGTVLLLDVATIVALTDRGMLPDWGFANPYQRSTALACVLLVALVALPRSATNRPSVLVTVLESRPLFLVGLVSYSLFLWHEPIIRLLAAQRITLEGTGGFLANVGIIALVSGVLAAATYRFVEQPALARKVGGTGPTTPGTEPTKSRLQPARTSRTVAIAWMPFHAKVHPVRAGEPVERVAYGDEAMLPRGRRDHGSTTYLPRAGLPGHHEQRSAFEESSGPVGERPG